MKTTYNFYNDGGHGWLKVTRAELLTLGIADKVSSYSYQRGGNVYLEEDCDASLFIAAKGGIGLLKIVDNYSDRSSKIRGYESYRHLSSEEVLACDKLRIAMLNYGNWNKAAIKRIDNAGLDVLKHWQQVYGFRA